MALSWRELVRAVLPRGTPDPVVDDEKARVVVAMLVVAGTASPLFVLATAIAGLRHIAVLNALTFAACALALVLLRRGVSITAVGVLLLVVGTIDILGSGVIVGGLRAPSLAWLPLPVVMAYSLFGRRAMVLVGALAVGGVVALSFTAEHVVSEVNLRRIESVSLVMLIGASVVLAVAVERARRDARSRLEDANQALALAKEQAEQASRAKSEFVATVSHELRTPLHAMVGLTELLSSSKLEEPQREYASTARQAAQSLLVIVDDLLDLSRIDANRVTLHPAPTDLRALVEGVAAMLSFRAREKGLRIEVAGGEDLPRVITDPARLRQVLVNLVDNAVKFTAQGHVRVSIEHDAPSAGRITVRLRVDDTGVGIAADKQSLIFDRFRQADGTTTRRYGGTGLGLAIARELLELMGGGISVTSTEGAGASFCATLSLFVDAGEAATLEGVRVLLAEDNLVNQRVARWMLEALGCVVEVAEDGRRAVELARAQRFDVVLMDCHMPEMDGYAAAEEIKRGPAKQVPILALTAGDEDAARARAAGMEDLLQKPIDPQGLRASLVRALRRPTPSTNEPR